MDDHALGLKDNVKDKVVSGMNRALDRRALA